MVVTTGWVIDIRGHVPVSNGWVSGDIVWGQIFVPIGWVSDVVQQCTRFKWLES